MSDFYMGNLPLYRRRVNRRCPKCGHILKTVIEERLIRSGTVGETFNDMKVYDTRYVCPVCRLKYADRDLQKIERKRKSRYINL